MTKPSSVRPHARSIGRDRARLACLLLTLASAVAPTIAEAGPWVDAEPGHGYVSVSFESYIASKYFTGPGDCTNDTCSKLYKPGTLRTNQFHYVTYAADFNGKSPNSYYHEMSALFYGEVSLYKGLGFVASLPMYRHVTEGLGSNMVLLNDPKATGTGSFSGAGVGDLNLGLKYQLPLGREVKGLVISPQVYFTAPTGDVDDRTKFPKGPYQQFNGNLPIPLGNGTVDIEGRISMGYSFYPVPVFLIGEVGLHHHFDAANCSGLAAGNGVVNGKESVTYSDDVPWTVQAGGVYSPKKKVKGFDHVTLIANAHGTRSLLNGHQLTGAEGALNVYERACGQSNNSSFFGFGGQIQLFPIKYLGVTYSIDHTLTGQNTGYGLTNIVGLASQF